MLDKPAWRGRPTVWAPAAAAQCAHGGRRSAAPRRHDQYAVRTPVHGELANPEHFLGFREVDDCAGTLTGRTTETVQPFDSDPFGHALDSHGCEIAAHGAKHSN